MTDNQLEEIRERAKKTTPGEWCIEDSCVCVYVQRLAVEVFNDEGEFGYTQRLENKRFAAHAHQDIPLLLAEVTRMRKELAKAKHDSERLDTMITNSWRVVHLPSHKDGPWHVWGPEGISGPRFGVGETPRAAINDAIAKEPK